MSPQSNVTTHSRCPLEALCRAPRHKRGVISSPCVAESAHVTGEVLRVGVKTQAETELGGGGVRGRGFSVNTLPGDPRVFLFFVSRKKNPGYPLAHY